MTAQYQTRNDNCVQACVASILDMPLHKVPHLLDMDHDGHGWDRLFKWVRRHRYQAVWIDGSNRVSERKLEKSGTYYMGIWPVRSGGTHAVVMRRGRLVFDPAGSTEIVGPLVGYVAFQKKGNGCLVFFLLLALLLAVHWIVNIH